MRIPVLVEPGYRHSLWAQQTLSGMTREAARKKYELLLLDATHYDALDWDGIFRGGRRLAVLIGTSLSWVPAAQAWCQRQSIGCVLISINPSQIRPAQGNVSMDHSEATFTLLRYLRDCGRSRVAFFALNPNSAADRTKLDAFSAWNRSADCAQTPHVFCNRGSLESCFSEFLPHLSRFNAVICANDIAAAALLPQLAQHGVRVPEDLHLVSYGDSALARSLRPTITSASLAHDELGRRAVNLYAFLTRQEETAASVSVQVRCHVIVRQSTAMTPLRQAEPDDPTAPDTVDFYADGEAQEIMALETLLEQSDETDLALFHGLLRGETQPCLQERLFLSPSALRHRQKNLMAWANCADHAAWRAFLEHCRALPLFTQ